MKQVKDQLGESFARHFPKEVLVWSKPRKEYPTWSSLKYVEFLFDLEGIFSIRFSPEDLLALQTVEEIALLIEKKRGES